jgi:hypothetical protein
MPMRGRYTTYPFNVAGADDRQELSDNYCLVVDQASQDGGDLANIFM